MNFQLPTGQSRHQSLHGNLAQIDIEIVRRPIWEMRTEHPLDKLSLLLTKQRQHTTWPKCLPVTCYFVQRDSISRWTIQKGIQVNISCYSLDRFTAMYICISLCKYLRSGKGETGPKTWCNCLVALWPRHPQRRHSQRRHQQQRHPQQRHPQKSSQHGF